MIRKILCWLFRKIFCRLNLHIFKYEIWFEPYECPITNELFEIDGDGLVCVFCRLLKGTGKYL